MADIAVPKETVTLTKSQINTLIERLLRFSMTASGVRLYPYQQEFASRIFQSLVLNDGAEITGLFSRQSGKTETLSVVATGAMIMLPLLARELPLLEKYKDGIWIGLFAPRGEQAYTTYSRTKDRIKSKNAKLILADPEVDEEAKTTGGLIV